MPVTGSSRINPQHSDWWLSIKLRGDPYRCFIQHRLAYATLQCLPQNWVGIVSKILRWFLFDYPTVRVCMCSSRHDTTLGIGPYFANNAWTSCLSRIRASESTHHIFRSIHSSSMISVFWMLLLLLLVSKPLKVFPLSRYPWDDLAAVRHSYPLHEFCHDETWKPNQVIYRRKTYGIPSKSSFVSMIYSMPWGGPHSYQVFHFLSNNANMKMRNIGSSGYFCADRRGDLMIDTTFVDFNKLMESHFDFYLCECLQGQDKCPQMFNSEPSHYLIEGHRDLAKEPDFNQIHRKYRIIGDDDMVEVRYCGETAKNGSFGITFGDKHEVLDIQSHPRRVYISLA